MNVKKFGLILALVAVVGVVGVGMSSAQTATPDVPGTPDTTTAPSGPGARLNRLRAGNVGSEMQRPLLQAILDTTKLSRLELLQAIRGGKTLADVITDHGGSVDAVIAQAVADQTQRINQAVTNGRLTQAQADKLIAALEPLDQAILSGDYRDKFVANRATAGVVLLAAQQTGLTPKDVVAEVRGGASLAQVLTEHQVDVNAFIETAAARVQARLNVQVVDGRMTQQQADDALAKFRSALTERINQPGGAAATEEATATSAT